MATGTKVMSKAKGDPESLGWDTTCNSKPKPGRLHGACIFLDGSQQPHGDGPEWEVHCLLLCALGQVISTPMGLIFLVCQMEINSPAYFLGSRVFEMRFYSRHGV